MNLKQLKYPKFLESNKFSIYVILRNGYVKNSPYGVYVGQTIKSPEERLVEHLSGIRSGRGLEKYGIQLVYSLMWPWQKVGHKFKIRYETYLHQNLKSFIPKVSGDIESKYIEKI